MKEIKIGDYVRMKHSPFEGQICQIAGIAGDGAYYTDRCSLCSEAHFEPIDPKTAFLEELKSLLSRYNACIWVQGGTDANLIISLNGDESVIPNICGVNADNIDIIKNKI